MESGEDSQDDVSPSLEAFIKDNHDGELVNILLEEDASLHFGLNVNALDLTEASKRFSDQLANDAESFLRTLDAAVQNAMKSIHAAHPDRDLMLLKENVHARIFDLPSCGLEMHRVTVPRSFDVGTFVALTGTIIRTTAVKLLEYERQYACRKCHVAFRVAVDECTPKPRQCPADECNSIKIDPVAMATPRSRDYQEIKIQEQVQRLAVGNIPRSMWVTLQDDLVDICKAGDDVTITGFVVRRWQPVAMEMQCNVEVILKANHVEVKNEQKYLGIVTMTMGSTKKEIDDFWKSYANRPITGRNVILASLCPQVFGLYLVKLAVSLVLIGGVARTDENGTRTRGESHLLLVGDPGTGKSQFLKYAAKLMPRSVLTTGIGSTSAGLTVMAVKVQYGWGAVLLL